jgi:hypothetical protein
MPTECDTGFVLIYGMQRVSFVLCKFEARRHVDHCDAPLAVTHCKRPR